MMRRHQNASRYAITGSWRYLLPSRSCAPPSPNIGKFERRGGTPNDSPAPRVHQMKKKRAMNFWNFWTTSPLPRACRKARRPLMTDEISPHRMAHALVPSPPLSASMAEMVYS